MSDAYVPLIDISALRAGGGAKDVATRIGAACERSGFFLVTGHGVDEALVAATYAAAREFFDLPMAEKLDVARRKAEISRGYNRLADQSLSYSRGVAAPPDLQESINFGPPAVPDQPYFCDGHAAVHFAPNLYPARPAGIEALVRRYYAAMEGLAATLMQGFALALNLPPDHFAGSIDRHVSSLRFVHYPEQVEAPVPGQLRAGAHTDYGSLTILRIEDAPGGLEVQDPSGRFVAAPVVPGSFVVNIGDLMAQWTNDRWVSTMHRVVNPPRDAALGSRRISLVFFHQPNHDAEIACLPSCLAPGAAPKYAPTTSGAHWRTKNQAARAMRATAATA